MTAGISIFVEGTSTWSPYHNNTFSSLLMFIIPTILVIITAFVVHLGDDCVVSVSDVESTVPCSG
jgi:hypothetical protein